MSSKYKNKKYNDFGGIYQIRNLQNNKVYIGSTNCFNRRKDEHFTNLRNNHHVNPHLQHAFNCYGEHNFVFEILEVIKEEKDLIKREQYWFDKINPCKDSIGYNILNEATEVNRIAHSEQTKRKISQSKKGTRAWNKGLKCPQWSGKNHGMYGKTHTPEVKQRLREFHLGRKLSEETKKRMSDAQKRAGNHPPFKRGIECGLSKPVQCISDNKVFCSIEECSHYYKISAPTIRRHCQNNLQFKKVNFKFISKEDYYNMKKEV